MNTTNPYAAPQSESNVGQSQANGAAEYAMVVGRLLSAMSTTKPWITFFAVVSFLFGSLSALGGLSVLFVSMGRGQTRSPLAMIGPGIALFYVLFAALYLVIGKLLWSYRSAISGFLMTEGSPEMLAVAVDKQASFWRFLGVLTLVSLILYFCLLVFTFLSVSSGTVGAGQQFLD